MHITEEMIADARSLIATGQAEPVGYRLMVKSIFVDTELELSQQAAFPELAKVGFQDKSEEEAERLSRGTFFGIVCDVGDVSYKNPHLGGKEWIEKGDVAIFERYAGIGINLPPGSDDEYRFMNDESILGRMIPKSED